ncbi:MAG: hypothetical protein NT038_09370 [Euryarchaeota archaeon]|nr:hypothetical protein [Euryarchaeota archaeon]
MIELESTQDNDEQKTKSHLDILRMLDELDVIEHRLLQLEEIQEPIQTTVETLEAAPQVTVTPEITIPTYEQLEEKKPHRNIFKIKIRRKKGQKPAKTEPEHKHRLIQRLRRKKDNLGETPEDLAAQGEIPAPKPLNGTFTLHRDEEGNLVGFPIKKPVPKMEKKHRRLLPFGKKKEEGEGETEQPEEPVKGIKGKIKRITSRFKRSKGKKEEKGSGGKFSKILSKIPIIGKRKEK